jgi:tetratricopeptide (TPR) repeat protein
LTDELKDLTDREWRLTLAKLRRARLLAEKDPAHPDTLDTHPLVREHFGGKLQQSHLDAWQEAHSRLYEYYKSQAKEYPDTIEEMAPLFAAVAHGCQAGRHQEAEDLYWRRVLRGEDHFSWRQLGSFGADLAALSGFFDPPWRQTVAGLSEASKAFVLHQAGLYLQALGQLAEAAYPMQAALGGHIAQGDWRNAAINACTLSELYLTSGDLTQALAYARQSVDLADRSGDAFHRMAMRTALADALHQAGRLPEAEAKFREAEEMQEERQPYYPLLYSLQGYQYCDLLLSQRRYREVLSRAGQTLEWSKQAGSTRIQLGLVIFWENLKDLLHESALTQQAHPDILSTALEHMSLGRAHLLQAQQEGSGDPSTSLRTSFSHAAAHLEQAVDGLRQAGRQHHIPRGLLARAELRRVMGALDRARADLEEAMSIATRGGMRLSEADCHLEYARLHLACGEEEKARESLAKAKDMIEDMGYHRRDGEVAELEGESESLKH